MSLDNKTDATSSTERTPITYEARHAAVQEKLGARYQEVAGKIHGVLSIIRSKLLPEQVHFFEDLLTRPETKIEGLTLFELVLLESYAANPQTTAAAGLKNFINEHYILKNIDPTGIMTLYDDYRKILLVAWKEILSNVIEQAPIFNETAANKALRKYFTKDKGNAAQNIQRITADVRAASPSSVITPSSPDNGALVTVAQPIAEALPRSEKPTTPAMSLSVTPDHDKEGGQYALPQPPERLSSEGSPGTTDTSTPSLEIFVEVHTPGSSPQDPKVITKDSSRTKGKSSRLRIVGAIAVVASAIVTFIIASKKPSTPSTDPVDTPNLQALDAGQDAEIKNVPGEQPTRTIDLGQDDNDASIPSASPKETTPDTKSSNFSIPNAGSTAVSHPIPSAAITTPVPTISPTTHPTAGFTAEPISTSVPITPPQATKERWF